MSKTAATPAAQLTDRILRAAQAAASEEDLKIAVERALEKALTALGIQSKPEYEKTILSGSADAVYGHVVIEYEKPGKLARETGLTETVEQLTRYLLGQTGKQGEKQAEALAKMIGVSLDGRQILFVRHTDTERGREFSLPGLPGGRLAFFEEKGVRGWFQILGPYPVNEDSIGVFLLYLRSLARDFGPSGEVALALQHFQHSARLRRERLHDLADEFGLQHLRREFFSGLALIGRAQFQPPQPGDDFQQAEVVVAEDVFKGGHGSTERTEEG